LNLLVENFLIAEYVASGGKAMSLVIQRLRNKWKESDFQISHEDLVRCIPNVMEELGIKVQKA
jgi:hypothetical protein